jgi:acetylornithine/succinyldiaminopimelate/putrescine aminotransferase
VAAAAALAVLDRLRAPGFLDDVGAKGLYLTRGLRRLAKRHKDKVADVRGMGLMLGVELRGPAAPVVKGLRERGILAVKSGESVLRLLPPLVVKRSEMKRLLDALGEVLASKETQS